MKRKKRWKKGKSKKNQTKTGKVKTVFSWTSQLEALAVAVAEQIVLHRAVKWRLPHPQIGWNVFKGNVIHLSRKASIGGGSTNARWEVISHKTPQTHGWVGTGPFIMCTNCFVSDIMEVEPKSIALWTNYGRRNTPPLKVRPESYSIHSVGCKVECIKKTPIQLQLMVYVLLGSPVCWVSIFNSVSI